MIVRELTGGIYFGEPRGIEPIENNEKEKEQILTLIQQVKFKELLELLLSLAKKKKKIKSLHVKNLM